MGSRVGGGGRSVEDIWPLVCSPGTVVWDYFRKMSEQVIISGISN